MSIVPASMVRTYSDMVAFQQDAAYLQWYGWHPSSVQHHDSTNVAGMVVLIFLVILFLPLCGIGLLLLFALPGPQTPEVIATYHLGQPVRPAFQPPLPLPAASTRQLPPGAPPMRAPAEPDWLDRLITAIDQAAAKIIPKKTWRYTCYACLALLLFALPVVTALAIRFMAGA
jgi:hypothetical protein